MTIIDLPVPLMMVEQVLSGRRGADPAWILCFQIGYTFLRLKPGVSFLLESLLPFGRPNSKLSSPMSILVALMSFVLLLIHMPSTELHGSKRTVSEDTSISKWLVLPDVV